VWWRAALVAAALTLALAPLPAPIVERYYSNAIFPALQRRLTGVSNLAPFALFDVLLVTGAAWWIASLGRDVVRLRSSSPGRILGRALVRTSTAAAVLYIAFAITWGLNYRRVPLTARLKFDAASVTPHAARELALRTVDEVNALYVNAHSELALRDPIADLSLTDAFARAQRTLGVTELARPSHPKRSIIDPYFHAAAVDGMTDPFFLETLLPSGLLPFELPAVIAHEWSHLAGFADEGEANFVGFLTCVRGSDAARYSGWLFLYRQLAAALTDEDRAGVSARLQPGPRADLRAIAERFRRQVEPAISDAGWRVYDRYLKANRVTAGTASYAEVVRLILGTRAGGYF
jgi:hypothetical protein